MCVCAQSSHRKKSRLFPGISLSRIHTRTHTWTQLTSLCTRNRKCIMAYCSFQTVRSHWCGISQPFFYQYGLKCLSGGKPRWHLLIYLSKVRRLWDYSKARWRLHNTSVLRNVVALRFRMFQLSMSFVSDCQMCQLTLHKELDWQVIWPIIKPNLLSCLTNTFRQENRLTSVDLTWKMLCVLMSFLRLK